MKLKRLAITDFRKFSRRIEIDLTDAFGHPKDTIVIVGPNAAGKTTMLDAIALAFEAASQLSCARADLPISASRLVHHGRLQAKVEMELVFSEEERVATCEMLDLAQSKWDRPTGTQLNVSWEFPDRAGQHRRGFCRFEPQINRGLVQGRRLVTDLAATRIVKPDRYADFGSVFTFDQKRESISRTIPSTLVAAIRPGIDDLPDTVKTASTDEVLLLMAIKASATDPQGRSTDPFRRVKELFAEVCAPNRIIGLARDSRDELFVKFGNGTTEFDFFGLSSGEQMVLSFLLNFVDRRISNSIVLIDELELHLHPMWQSQLFHALHELGHDNQLIITTHSPYLRDMVPSECLYEFGELGDELVTPAVEVDHA